jgi:hypothetical protein
VHAHGVLAKLAAYGDRPALLAEIPVPGDEAGAPSALLLLDLAEGQRRAGDPATAQRMVTRALEALEAYPTTRAAAQAEQAMIALDRGQPAAAPAGAQRAFESTATDSPEQRRMQILLAYVCALDASGRRDEAAQQAACGWHELEARAAAIVDPALRASFLDAVSIHRDLRQAARRLGVTKA